MKTKATMKKKTYKDNDNNAVLCCDTTFDISWFKNLFSDAGYWILCPAMTSVLGKKWVLRVYD